MSMQREWLETDYYEVLGISADASKKDITKAYRQLAREYHPDQHPDDPAAETRFKEISAAYSVLSDDDKRAEYDEVRRLGPMAGGQPGGGPGGFTFNMNDMAGGDISDLLGQMFGGAGGRRGGVAPTRGADITATLTMDFEDAVNGITTSLHLTADAQCTTCTGSGAAPGTSPQTCSRCGGRGVLDEDQGLFAFSSPCPACRGAGAVITDPCPTCRGSGVERRPREVKVRIPAGVDDGQTIRLKGRGAPGRSGGPAGDLFVEIAVAPHDRFTRSGKNLQATVPVSFAEAALGGDIDVPVLDGGTVKMHIRAGTASGSRHRVKGYGIPGPSGTGDLIVTVTVAVPTDLTDEQRAAIEQLAATSIDPRSRTE